MRDEAQGELEVGVAWERQPQSLPVPLNEAMLWLLAAGNKSEGELTSQTLESRSSPPRAFAPPGSRSLPLGLGLEATSSQELAGTPAAGAVPPAPSSVGLY
ncbi:unnamed protein product [Rangifer tarandus platyrhynchus]|uniref:Uncharacterized protein n=2 Tax=Rangifer tarandus platyrhynchus TaxID=3082113 RepID=A0ACB0F1Y2_RANTA|nr:unnamed protein product [Rangifer tarandus platyrhynchus]CAI9706931.1 unnamed protein product [Rangifer tarandus platyrhynchus]